MPKNSANFLDDVQMRGLRHEPQHEAQRRRTAPETRSASAARYRYSSSSGVSRSALSSLRPVMASSTENRPQEYSGISRTTDPAKPHADEGHRNRAQRQPERQRLAGLRRSRRAGMVDIGASCLCGAVLAAGAMSAQRGEIARQWQGHRPCASRWAGWRGQGGLKLPRMGRASVSGRPARLQDQVEMGEGVAHFAQPSRQSALNRRAGRPRRPSHRRESPSCRPADPLRAGFPPATDGAVARQPERCRAAWAFPAFGSLRGRSAWMPCVPRLHTGRTAGRSRRPGCAGCRSWRQGPSPPAHDRRGGQAASGCGQRASVPAWPWAAAFPPRKAAPSPVRHCHRPPSRARSKAIAAMADAV